MSHRQSSSSPFPTWDPGSGQPLVATKHRLRPRPRPAPIEPGEISRRLPHPATYPGADQDVDQFFPPHAPDTPLPSMKDLEAGIAPQNFNTPAGYHNEELGSTGLRSDFDLQTPALEAPKFSHEIIDKNENDEQEEM
jgi:hypothetical protein